MTKTIRVLIAIACTMIAVSAIFFFSEQSGTESHEVSSKAAEGIAHMMTDNSSRSFSEKDMKILVNALDYPIRKIAHLSIYFFLGFVMYISVVFVQKEKMRPALILPCLLFVILVATADEVNQFYNEGRGSSPADVLIDTVGGALGIYFYYMITDFIGHVKKLFRKQGDIES